MPHDCVVLHANVAGRLRLKLPKLLRHPTLAHQLERELSTYDVINCARASSTTATVLVEYSPGHSVDNVITIIERAMAAATEPQPPAVKAWWCLPAQEILFDLGVSLDGLSTIDAEDRRNRIGPNVLPQAESPSRWSVLFNQFTSLPIVLLCGSTVASVVTGGLLDAALVAGVVAANVIIGYATESKAEAIIGSYMKHERPTAVARRDGVPTEIAAEYVVPGDIIVLMPGTVLVADARVIVSNELSVDESPLTGESLPVIKTTDTLTKTSSPVGDRSNMVYAGTVVVSGSGLAVVIATADATEIGQIAAAVAATQQTRTPMQRQLDRLGTQLTVASLASSGIVLGLGFLYNTPISHLLRASIALAVAAIPEGLPTVATSVLATGLREMQRHNVLIRRLAAVETLGSVNVLCFDKTGTLTQNRMTASTVITNGHCFSVLDGFVSEGQPIEPNDDRGLMQLLRVAALCNDTQIQMGRDTQIVNGSATESALLLLAMRAGIDIVRLRKSYPILHSNLRSEQRRYMQTVHDAGDRSFTAIKGNPVEVLDLCDYYMRGTTLYRLGDVRRREIIAENDDMTSHGLRVLGFSCSENGSELVWLGLVGLTDPARPGMPALIEDFHKAGIRTVMITGDQPGTALAVANELGLASDVNMFNGTDLEDLSPVQLDTAVPDVDVFSRVSPIHKLKIVKSLQRTDHVVAMTGDGTNDGPALRAANIGVAMGVNGTDAAREVSDVILAEDDLTTMIIAIREGRTIYSNIRKAVHFLVGTNSSEVLLTLSAATLGLGRPLSAAQLLWINLVTDVAIAYSLGFEQPETDVMLQPPRPLHENIITAQDWKRLLRKASLFSGSALATHVYGMMKYGPLGGGVAFASLTAAQLLDGFSSRSESKPVWKLPANHILHRSILALLGLQIAAMLWPPSRNLLGVAALDLTDLAVIAGGSVGPFLAVETLSKSDSAPLLLEGA